MWTVLFDTVVKTIFSMEQMMSLIIFICHVFCFHSVVNIFLVY